MEEKELLGSDDRVVGSALHRHSLRVSRTFSTKVEELGGEDKPVLDCSPAGGGGPVLRLSRRLPGSSTFPTLALRLFRGSSSSGSV